MQWSEEMRITYLGLIQAKSIRLNLYPNWNIFRYPKKYEVRAKRDQDFCDKAFDGANDFAYGIFSVDCSCKANINYGYELMLTRESAHNLFR